MSDAPRKRRIGATLVALGLALGGNVLIVYAIAAMNLTAAERGPELASSVELLRAEPPELLPPQEEVEEELPDEPEPEPLDPTPLAPDMQMDVNLDQPLLDLALPSLDPVAMQVVVRQGQDASASLQDVANASPNVAELRSEAIDAPPKELSSNRQPRYPRSALRQKLEGVVKVDLLIDERGRVIDVKLLEGASPFRDAVLDVVRRWRFTPPKDKGNPVQVWGLKTFRFDLPRR